VEGEKREHWRTLCEQAVTEQDLDKLIQLTFLLKLVRFLSIRYFFIESCLLNEHESRSGNSCRA
jgi:hypothetical protein